MLNLEMNKYDGVIIAGGFMMALSAWIRFFVLSGDLGETFLAGVLGVVIMAIGWIHNNQYKKAITNLKRYNEYLDLAEYIASKPWEEDDEQL